MSSSFKLTDAQVEKVSIWINSQKEKQDMYTGAIGGRFSYKFTPTGLGDIIVVIDEVLKDELNISDYSDW